MAKCERWSQGAIFTKGVSKGRGVTIALPPQAGDDFNDLLMRDGADAVRTVLERALPDAAEETPLVTGRGPSGAVPGAVGEGGGQNPPEVLEVDSDGK